MSVPHPLLPINLSCLSFVTFVSHSRGWPWWARSWHKSSSTHVTACTPESDIRWCWSPTARNLFTFSDVRHEPKVFTGKVEVWQRYRTYIPYILELVNRSAPTCSTWRHLQSRHHFLGANSGLLLEPTVDTHFYYIPGIIGPTWRYLGCFLRHMSYHLRISLPPRQSSAIEHSCSWFHPPRKYTDRGKRERKRRRTCPKIYLF